MPGLMDEPLGSLDKNLRRSFQLELRQLQRTIGITTIYVTDDQEEAFSLSDKIAVMGGGRIRKLAPPEEIYHRRADLFVAEFVGDLNRWSGVVVAVQENRLSSERRETYSFRWRDRDAHVSIVKWRSVSGPKSSN